MTYTAANIQRIRHTLHLTQVGFAARLGLSPTIVSRWECGVFQPGSASKAKIEALLATEQAKAEHIADTARHAAPAP